MSPTCQRALKATIQAAAPAAVGPDDVVVVHERGGLLGSRQPTATRGAGDVVGRGEPRDDPPPCQQRSSQSIVPTSTSPDIAVSPAYQSAWPTTTFSASR